MELPIKAARKIADTYGWDQVAIVARKVGDDGIEHVVTYGKDTANCEAAARVGMALKHHLMQWPSELSNSDIKVNGVSRDAENKRAVVIYLDKELVGDELQMIHDFLKPPTHSPREVEAGA